MMTEKPTVNHKCQCAACRASRALSTLRALPALTDSTTEALDTIDEALSALIDDGAAGWAAMGDVAYAVGLDWPTATRRDILDAIRAASRRLAELAAALAAQQWRPVTEKPEQPDTYLVYRGGAAHNEPWRYDFAVWEDAWDTEAFSHWRPLPPTPAETTQ